MNVFAVLSTFSLGEAQHEAWNDENGALEELLEEAASAFEASFADDHEFGDGYQWGDAGRRLGEEVALEAPPIADEEDDRRRRAVMSKLGLGVCRTANGGVGRYKSVHAANGDQCRAKCMAETACVAFEYTFMSSPINPGWCEIHYEPISKTIYTTTNTCEVKATVTPGWTCYASKDSGSGTGPLNDAGVKQSAADWWHCPNFGFASLDACKSRCARTPNCKWTMYDPAQTGHWCPGGKRGYCLMRDGSIPRLANWTPTGTACEKTTGGGRRMDGSETLLPPSGVDLEN